MKRFMHLLTVILMCVLLLCAACLPAGAASFLRGDADADGSITIMDATVIQRILAGMSKDTDGSITVRCAVTSDKLNIMDATAIQRYLAKFDDVHGIGETVTTDGSGILIPTDPNQLPIITV